MDKELLTEARKLFIESDHLLQLAARGSSKKGFLRALRRAFHDTLTNTDIKLVSEAEANVAATIQNLLQSWTILKADQMEKIQKLNEEKENGEKQKSTVG